jgi:hypothetical protein
MQNLRIIPALLVDKAKTLGICSSIHNNDFLFDFVLQRCNGNLERAIEKYYESGRNSAAQVRLWVSNYRKSLELIHQRTHTQESSWSPRDILDFASGYGAAAGHLPHQFPNAKIQTCDIHSDAVAFNANVLKLESYQSSVTPEAVELPPQDVIICLSFFSHMPKTTFSRWLNKLFSHLSPQGVLIFTAHGHVSHTCGGVKDIEIDQEGFGFKEKSEQRDLSVTDYGSTIAYPSYVLSVMRELGDARLVRFQEGLWWRMQDAYMYAKT